MSTKLTISVTQEDINQGVKSNCRACPIALATLRILEVAQIPFDKEFIDVVHRAIYTHGINGYLGNKGIKFKLPIEATHFISCFDNGLPVVPFSFEIDIDKS